MAICEHCGTEIGEGVKFCAECGAAQAPQLRQVASEPQGFQPVQPKAQAPASHSAKTLVLLGGMALLIGAFMPWATITAAFLGRVSKAGYEGDGLFTGGIGLLLLIGGLVSKGKPGKMYSVASAVFAIIAGFILVTDLVDVGSIGEDLEMAVVQTGAGLYVSLVGALLALIGGLRRVPES